MTLALGQIWLNFTSVVFEEMNCYKRFTDGRSNTWTVRHTRKGLEQHLSSFLVSLEPKKKFELNTYYEIRTTLSTIFFMKNY